MSLWELIWAERWLLKLYVCPEDCSLCFPLSRMKFMEEVVWVCYPECQLIVWAKYHIHYSSGEERIIIYFYGVKFRCIISSLPPCRRTIWVDFELSPQDWVPWITHWSWIEAHHACIICKATPTVIRYSPSYNYLFKGLGNPAKLK